MGGLDIYIAKVNSITRKYELTHPGYPLNTEADDFGMTSRVSTTRASSAPTEKTEEATIIIYSFENPKIYHDEGMGLRERRL